MSQALSDVSYIKRSEYRNEVCEVLFDKGPSMPSTIADELDIAKSHTSRALRELENNGLVALLVDEDQTAGRLYDLTTAGTEAVQAIQTSEEIEQVLTVPPSNFSHQQLLTFLHEATEVDVLSLAYSHGTEVELTFTATESSPGSGNDDVMPELLADIAEVRRNNGEQLQTLSNKQFELIDFEEMTVLYLWKDPDEVVIIGLELREDLLMPSFALRCLEKI